MMENIIEITIKKLDARDKLAFDVFIKLDNDPVKVIEFAKGIRRSNTGI